MVSAQGTSRLASFLAASQSAARLVPSPIVPVVTPPRQLSGPVLKYRGSKWRLASWILDHFPTPDTYTTYIEPFFGSGAVFFTKPPSKHEILNDINGDVVNFFRVLREHAHALAALIQMTPWARAEYDASYAPARCPCFVVSCSGGVDPATGTSGGGCKTCGNCRSCMTTALTCDDRLEAARRFVVRCWQAQHLDLTRHTVWRHNGPRAHSSTTSLWAKVPERLLAAAERLKRAEIECRPALELIARHARPDVVLYVDPPYVLSTRGRRRLYTKELSDAEHVALLEALDAHPGPVVLSGYTSRLYDTRLAHWRRYETGSVAEGGGARTEVLWVKPAGKSSST